MLLSLDKSQHLSPLVGDIVTHAMICPKCGSRNCSQCDTEEQVFCRDNTTHYFVVCHCSDCSNHFKLHIGYKYALCYFKAETHMSLPTGVYTPKRIKL